MKEIIFGITFVYKLENIKTMKNLFLLFAVCTTIIFTSCEGPQGPPGPQGDSLLGQVFEVTVDLNQNNNYSRLITYPNNLVVYESDVVLVYLLEDVVNGFDVWSQLPQTYFLNQGTLLYSFDYTFLDVSLFLDANFDLNTLGSDFTDDQTFRIAIVPSEFANANLTMDELMSNLQIDISDIEVLPN